MLVLVGGSSAWATLLSPNLEAISMANGAKYGSYDMTTYGVSAGQYYDKSTGGGLNAEYVAASSTAGGTVMTESTTTGSNSGTFYLRDTGGRGFTDDIILAVSVKGSISDNFGLNITSNGYTWTPNPVANTKPTTTSYVTGVNNQLFTKSDFIYGPQTGRPGNQGVFQAFYAGQDMTDPATAENIMFIDLNVGAFNGSSIENGAVKVDYSFESMLSSISFNMYGWCLNSNQGQGINWTNNAQASGYTVNYTGAAPVPIPPAVFLFGSGLSGLFFFRRRNFIA